MPSSRKAPRDAPPPYDERARAPRTPHITETETSSISTTESSSRRTKEENDAKAGFRWGVTPGKYGNHFEQKNAPLPPDHPLHKISPEKQAKMRAKGVNPVLKAEMDAATKGEGGFWVKVAGTAGGGGWIR